MPRTWPSIRFSRFAHDALMSLRIWHKYPPWYSLQPRFVRNRAMAVARKQNASSDMAEAMAASHPSGAHDPKSAPPRSRSLGWGCDERDAGPRARSGLRNDGRSAHDAASPPIWRTNLLFLLGRMPGHVRRGSREISRSFGNEAARHRARGHHLHLPDASRRSGRSGRALVRSAAWRSSPRSRRRRPGPIPSLST